MLKNITSRMLLVLTAVAVISAGFLGYVSKATGDRIEHNRRERIKNAVYEVLPGIDRYSRVNDNPVIFKGTAGGEDEGYAVTASGMGFQGEISLMVGVEKDISGLTGISVLESVETPGLGDRIKESEFKEQFKGKALPEDGTMEVDAITGATISSDAVKKIIEKAIKDVKGIR